MRIKIIPVCHNFDGKGCDKCMFPEECDSYDCDTCKDNCMHLHEARELECPCYGELKAEIVACD